MYCPKCRTEVMNDALFCPKCGATVSSASSFDFKDPEDMEKTMTIPAVRIRETEERTSPRVSPPVHTPAAKPVSKTHPKPVAQPPAKKSRKNTALVCAVVFLTAVVIVLGAALTVVLLKKEPVYENIVETPPVSQSAPVDTGIQEEPVVPEETPEGESVVVEEIKGVRIDKGFAFAGEVALNTEGAEYKTLQGTDYKCDVPSDFEFVYDNDGEIRYAQKENTAYMDIGVIANHESVGADEIRSKAISDIDGNLLSSENGDNWYSITAEKNNIIYHHKCFVSEGNIIYCEVVYPSVYGEIYGAYVPTIDNSFEMIQ